MRVCETSSCSASGTSARSVPTKSTSISSGTPSRRRRRSESSSQEKTQPRPSARRRATTGSWLATTMRRSPTADEGTSEATLLVAAISSSSSSSSDSVPGTVITRGIRFIPNDPDRRLPPPDGPSAAKLPAARSRRLVYDLDIMAETGRFHRNPNRLIRETGGFNQPNPRRVCGALI
uniref:Uncharacterized protein n=1 Tax=Arundo donax TaxID=35708 RepID=A0A0A9CYE4_ARUDO